MADPPEVPSPTPGKPQARRQASAEAALDTAPSTTERELLKLAEAANIEPADYNDTQISLQTGKRATHAPASGTICDALMTDRPGELTFPINRRLADILTVTDAEVAEAVRYAFRVLKLVVEPGGAVSLAALLAGKIEAKGLTTAVVLSGGNVDPALFADIIEGRFPGMA